jgi:protein-disulfide isomerase
MKASLAFLALPLLLVAGCGGSGGDANTSAQAAPVAAVAPPAGKQWSDIVSKTDDGGYRMGNPDAPLKLIEFGSRTCPHCAKFDQEGVPELEKKYVDSGKVSYEFHDYPVHAALDMAPILLGQCVEPDSFFPMLDQMMADQQQFMDKLNTLDQSKMQDLSTAQIPGYLAQELGYIDFVRARGVPEDKARKCLSDQASLDAIAKQTQTATQKYNITGTPTFVLNGNVVDGVVEWSQLEPRLKAAGA